MPHASLTWLTPRCKTSDAQRSAMNLIERIHHVAYRCNDAKQTVDWYEKHLGMRFVLAIAENEVPSTKAPDPCMIFKSIYFFDQNGHRLELAADTGTPTIYRELDDVKREMLAEWSRTRRAPACGLDARWHGRCF